MSLGCLGDSLTPKPLGRHKPSDLYKTNMWKISGRKQDIRERSEQRKDRERRGGDLRSCALKDTMSMRLTLAVGKDMAHLKDHVHPQGEMRDPLGQQDSAEGGERMGSVCQSRSERRKSTTETCHSACWNYYCHYRQLWVCESPACIEMMFQLIAMISYKCVLKQCTLSANTVL